VLTDSGGFQAMSLAKINSINEEGIHFRSHLDGTPLMLTPESAIRHPAAARRRYNDGTRRMHALPSRASPRAQVARAHRAMAERSLAARVSTTKRCSELSRAASSRISAS